MAKLLCVYCASSDRLAPKYYALADALGQRMVRRGWGLVYGGGRVGMMGTLARSVKRAGGQVVGVIPEFMVEKELAFEEADELERVQTMRERKQAMERRADAFLALPGGWGTLEEIAEILTLRQLDALRKPCGFLNLEGYYDELLGFFDRMVDEAFSRPSNRDLYFVATTTEEALELLEGTRVREPESKWYHTA